MDNEMRRYKRLNYPIEVRYYYGTNTEPVKVFTEDISKGGIRIHNPFPINERFQFPMQILLDQPVKAIAKVAWQRKQEDAEIWEMGLEFVQMQEEDRNFVSKFVEATDGSGID